MKHKYTNIKTFGDLLDFIKSNKFFLKKVLIISLLLTSFYSFVSEVYYQSEITLYPAGELADSGEIFSDFSDLIETLGINNLSSENNFYIPDIIESRSLKKKIIYEKWNNEKFDKPVDLISYWEINEKSLFGSLLSSVNNTFNSFKINLDLQYEQEAIEKLDNLIYVDEKNSGLIQVVVLMEEPILAADIANYIAQYVVDYVSLEQKMFASKTKRYLQDRLLLSQSELRKSENILAEFRKVNPLN